MNQVNKYFKFDGYILLYALFISLYVVYQNFSGLDFSLFELKNLYIGEATKYAVNIGARSSIIYKGIAVFTPSFLIAYYFFSRFLKQSVNRNLIFLSAVGILQLLVTALDIDNFKTIHLFFYVFIFIATLLSLPLPQTIREKIAGKKLAAYNVVLCYLIVYNFQVLFPEHTWINQNSSIVFILLFILFCSFPLIFGQKYYPKIQPYFITISITPLLAFLAIEFDVNNLFGFGYKKIFVLLFSGVLLLTILLKLTTPLRIPKPENALKYCLIPALLVYYILSIRYTPFIETIPEFFELANPANSLMNIFQYHEIPFVDFMSSHMFSEQGYGIVYTFFNGYTADVSFYSYVFINDIIGILVLYYFLNKAFNKPIYSVAFILTFPFLYYFIYPPIFLGILALFQSIKVIDNQSVKNYFFLFVLLIGLIIWRLDTGVAALFTTLVFFPLFLFIKRAKIFLPNFIKALLLFLGVIGTLLIGAILMRSTDYVLNNFISALHYVKGSQAHGYAQIKNIAQHQYFIYHIIFPIIAIIAIIIAVFKLRMEKNRYLLFSLFCFLLYFANVQRGLVRHGFAEQKEFYLISVFYLALTLFLVGIINKKNIKELLFYGLGFFIVLFTKFFNFHPHKTDLEKSLSESTFYNLPSYFEQTPRTRVIGQDAFATAHYEELKAYLDRNLTPEQSFVDFSNTPMLYFYTERKSPGYFNQNLQNTIDDKTQLHLLEQISTTEHPIVIYAHSPRNWFDRTDGIANTIRYYLLSEFIHQNYEPAGIVQGYSIWKAKSSNIATANLPADTLLHQAQDYEYGFMAGLMASYYEKNHVDYLQNVALNSKYASSKEVNVSIGANAAEFGSIYLDMNLENVNSSQRLTVDLYDDKEQRIGGFTFQTHPDIGKRYMLRLSNHYLWHTSKVKKLIIHAEQAFNLEEIRLLKDTRLENKTTTAHR